MSRRSLVFVVNKLIAVNRSVGKEALTFAEKVENIAFLCCGPDGPDHGCPTVIRPPGKCRLDDGVDHVLNQCPGFLTNSFASTNSSGLKTVCELARAFLLCMKQLTVGCRQEQAMSIFGSTDKNYASCCLPAGKTIECPMKVKTCSDAPCLHDAVCSTLSGGGGGFSCACQNGFNGARCENNINECASNPCPANATCDDLINGYRCICPPGYQGDKCNELFFTCTQKGVTPHPHHCDHFFVCEHEKGAPVQKRCGPFALNFPRLFDTHSNVCTPLSRFNGTQTRFTLAKGCWPQPNSPSSSVKFTTGH